MTLYRKYRPQKFADLVGQDHIRDTLIQASKEGKIAQAYLFTGPRGTGKTTTARLISKVANCQELEAKRISGQETDGEPCGQCDSCLEIRESKSLDIIEIDAASNRSIDDIRELREQVRFAPAKSKFKVYIIDEVHMLTREAFNALLKTLEEPPKHAIFILATTEPHKVLPTIISRTQRFDFKRIDVASLAGNLQKVVDEEGLKGDKEALEMIAVLADGGGRDSLSLLEQVAAYSSNISAGNVKSILGIVEIDEIANLIRAIFNSDAEEGLKIAHTFFEAGNNMNQLNASIVDVCRKLLTYRISETFYSAETAGNKKIIISLCQVLQEQYDKRSTGRLLQIIKYFIDAGKMMKETVDPLVAMEVAIVESCEASENLKAAAPDLKTKSATLPKPLPQNDKLAQTVVEDASNKPKKEEGKKETMPAEKITTEVKSEINEAASPIQELPNELWQSVIAEVKKENNSLAALLKDAKPMAIEAGKLVLGVRFKFHKDKISETKNVQVLEGIICNVTGNSCRLQCEIADFSANKNKESHSDEELADEAERVFSE